MTETDAILAVTPPERLAPGIALAASRAGSLGLLDLTVREPGEEAEQALARLRRSARPGDRWGVRWDTLGATARSPRRLGRLLAAPIETLVLGGAEATGMTDALRQARPLARRVLLEVTSAQEAVRAQDAGYDGVIVRGQEAAGRVAATSAFVLLQRLRGRLSIPYWIQGGIGLNTIAAVRLAGAAGVVLCEQLWLADEAPFGDDQRAAWARFDGSQTRLLGDGDRTWRLLHAPGSDLIPRLERQLATGADRQALLAGWRSAPADTGYLLVGQDLAAADHLAQRYRTVGRIVTAFRERAEQNLEAAQRNRPFAPGAGVAEIHGTRYPIVQGPMTRVSDVVPFARAVAEAGGLPFLALSVMRPEQAEALLEDASRELAALPWGVGILGFVPALLRRLQLEILHRVRPPYCIISGGRPDQAEELEKRGIQTYLHVPSPRLLTSFLEQGARKVILEGSECGGHVGPRTSFELWDRAVETLLAAPLDDPEAVQVLFAGGIHDELSAAMAAAIAAPLAERRMRTGVLMGSAYLFTHEIVDSGALAASFRRQALDCEQTVLLRSGAGYATRCAPSPYREEFERRKRELLLAEKDGDEILETLERLNVGRLRIAAKGIARDERAAGDACRYVELDEETRHHEGLYMLGEVATLRRSTMSVAELHEQVSAGGSELLAGRRTPNHRRPRAPLSGDIAIIGMACLFPGAASLEEYWHNILGKVDTVREVTDDRWRQADFFDPDPRAPDKVYSKWGGFLDAIPFDPTSFGIPPTSLRSIEPMQLLALEVSRRALAEAGLDRRPFPRDRTAVIFGTGGVHDLGNDYAFRSLLAHYLPRVPGLTPGLRSHILATLQEQLPRWTEDSFPGVLGNLVAGRVANRLDLGGSNFTVDAACASSLAALDVGVQELRSGKADVAIIGAVDGTNHIVAYTSFAKTHALSPTGRCRPFDATADGIVISEGVAALVLRRLADAERDGDRIHAVIKGIGSSSDGRNRSLTAPHPTGQLRALRRAYEDAGVEPATIGLVEAHGTGTVVGDRSEIECLAAAFGDGDRDCALGSVKSMIGHTKVAAGLAGLIKGVLALEHRLLPPTLGVTEPNPALAEPAGPLYLNTETRPWLEPPGRARRCAVSAFGFGGTNFHAVLEEYDDGRESAPGRDLLPREVEIFAFSAADRPRLADALAAILELPERLDGLDRHGFAELARALRGGNAGRSEAATAVSRCRLAVVAESLPVLRRAAGRAAAALRADRSPPDDPGVFYGENPAPPATAFLFPGQGSQRLDMLRRLVVAHPAMRRPFEIADELLAPVHGGRLSTFVYPRPAFSRQQKKAQRAALDDTRIAQPALAAADLAALDLFSLFGLEADAVAGHSLGEYVALCAAGVLDRRTLIRLVARRGEICSEASPAGSGAMLSVAADAETITGLIDGDRLAVRIACLNAPRQTVLAGSRLEVEQAEEAIRRHGLATRRLAVTAAFHTPALTEAARRLAEELDGAELAGARMPVYSNTLAAPFPTGANEVRRLLARHLTEPLRFAEQIERMYTDGIRVFVEVGPGMAQSGLVGSILGERPHRRLGLGDFDPGWQELGALLAEAWAIGLGVDLDRWFTGRDLRASSPAEVLARFDHNETDAARLWRVDAGRAVPWGEPLAAPLGPVASEAPADAKDRRAALAELLQLQQRQQALTRRLVELEDAAADGAPRLARLEPRAVSPSPVRHPGEPASPSPSPLVAGRDGKPGPADPSAAVTAGQLPQADAFERRLLAAVMDHTGYPRDMLDPDARLEAELGIDSIKRLEIISGLDELHVLRRLLDDPGNDQVIEELGRLKTLREIADWYRVNRERAVAAGSDAAAGPPGPRNEARQPDPVRRFLLHPVARELGPRAALPPEPWLLLVGPDRQATACLAAAIEQRGYELRWVCPGRCSRQVAANRFDWELSSVEAVRELHRRLAQGGGSIGGLLFVAASDNGQAPANARSLFLLAKVFADDLVASRLPGGGRLLHLTTIDGSFGLNRQRVFSPIAASSLGVAKTAARERPGLRVQCLDFDPRLGAAPIAGHVIDELEAREPSLEVGYTQDGRWVLELEETPRGESHRGNPALPDEPVLLVTGGADGVTAEVVKVLLARLHRPRLVLVGRSPFPPPEPEATRPFVERGDLRRWLIEQVNGGRASVTPAEIERRLGRILKNRRIRDNIAAMEATGARVEYRSLDVRCAAAFATLIDDAYERWGRIDGVIHGAGVIEDRPIRHKTLDSFTRVFETKVTPAAVLADKLRPESLRFLLLFSSVAGRFGNFGQSDYSAANEMLNKTASLLSGRWPGARVAAVNWGPWDSGMVDDSLRKLYASQGIHTIPVETGVRLCLEEIDRPPSEPAEVVITSSLDQIATWSIDRN